MFKSFPSALLQRIRSEAYHFVVGKHHFFHYIYQFERETFSKLCSDVMLEQSVDHGHHSFVAETEGEGMYFICHGKLSYSEESLLASESFMDMSQRAEGSWRLVSAGMIISEASMWLHWFHQGSLMGEAVVSDLLFLRAERFRELMKGSLLSNDVRLYARLYALRALRAGKEQQVDDLWHEEEMIEEIVKLSLHGGLELAVNNLAGGRVTPQRILKAWRKEAQSGRYRHTPMTQWRREEPS